MIKKIFAWVILVMLLAYVVCAAVWARAEASKNSCNGIDIQIVQGHAIDSVSHKGVMAEINRYPEKLVGAQIPTINTRQLEQYLKSFPQFEDVVCNFTTAGRLNVKVTPMVPEIRVFEDSLSYYINKNNCCKKQHLQQLFFNSLKPVTAQEFFRLLL